MNLIGLELSFRLNVSLIYWLLRYEFVSVGDEVGFIDFFIVGYAEDYVLSIYCDNAV